MKVAIQSPGAKRTLNRFASVKGASRASFPWSTLAKAAQGALGALG